ncbi:MAG: hypothetical protein WCK42_09655, partial [Myxococcaceae bacterium]
AQLKQTSADLAQDLQTEKVISAQLQKTSADLSTALSAEKAQVKLLEVDIEKLGAVTANIQISAKEVLKNEKHFKIAQDREIQHDRARALADLEHVKKEEVMITREELVARQLADLQKKIGDIANLRAFIAQVQTEDTALYNRLIIKFPLI